MKLHVFHLANDDLKSQEVEYTEISLFPLNTLPFKRIMCTLEKIFRTIHMNSFIE